ncbi:MAG TPA: hypothetical protein VI139_04370 [Gemmatimonadales bacterium]
MAQGSAAEHREPLDPADILAGAWALKRLVSRYKFASNAFDDLPAVVLRSGDDATVVTAATLEFEHTGRFAERTRLQRIAEGTETAYTLERHGVYTLAPGDDLSYKVTLTYADTGETVGAVASFDGRGSVLLVIWMIADPFAKNRPDVRFEYRRTDVGTQLRSA